MQDETRTHHTELIFHLLNEHSGQNVIALDYQKLCGGEIDWPAYLPDLNLCDFFCGDTKTEFYQIN
jgi:hypothetical protein